MGTCEACHSGLVCPGRMEPYARPGFFQTRQNYAVRCLERRVGDLCKGGEACSLDRHGPGCVGHWGNRCASGVTGYACQNCDVGWHHGPEYSVPCYRCADSAATLASIIATAIFRVVFAAFAAVMAARAAFSAKAVHVTMARIGIQWFTVISLLANLDDNRALGLKSLLTDGGRPFLLNAIEVIMRNFWQFLTPHQAGECLADSWFPEHPTTKRLLSLLSVLLFPVLLLLITVAVSALIVYVICPLCDHLGIRTLMKGWLKVKLIAKGCSKEQAETVVEENCGNSFAQIAMLLQQSPEFWTDVEHMKSRLGHEAAEQIVRRQLRERLQQYRRKLNRVQYARAIDALKQMTPDQLEEVNMYPSHFIEQAKKGRGFVSAARQDAENIARQDEENIARPILGIFSVKPSLVKLVRESFTIVLISWYHEWAYIVASLLGKFWCFSSFEDSSVVRRLSSDPDVLCDSSEHARLAILSALGLAIWGLGVPALLFCILKFLGRDRYTPRYLSELGYFIHGQEPEMWWWEVTVKRLDLLLILCITYFDATVQWRLKLVAYCLVSGLMLALQNKYNPYDPRHCFLLDRTESNGLLARFAIFAIFAAAVRLESNDITFTILTISALVLFLLVTLIFLLRFIIIFLQHHTKVLARVADLGTDTLIDQATIKEIKEQPVIMRFCSNILRRSAQHLNKWAQWDRQLSFRVKWTGVGKAQEQVKSKRGCTNRAMVYILGLSVDQQKHTFCAMVARFLRMWTTRFCMGRPNLPTRTLDIMLLLAIASTRLSNQGLAVTKRSLQTCTKKILKYQAAGDTHYDVFADDLVLLLIRLSGICAADVVDLVEYVDDKIRLSQYDQFETSDEFEVQISDDGESQRLEVNALSSTGDEQDHNQGDQDLLVATQGIRKEPSQRSEASHVPSSPGHDNETRSEPTANKDLRSGDPAGRDVSDTRHREASDRPIDETSRDQWPLQNTLAVTSQAEPEMLPQAADADAIHVCGENVDATADAAGGGSCACVSGVKAQRKQFELDLQGLQERVLAIEKDRDVIAAERDWLRLWLREVSAMSQQS